MRVRADFEAACLDEIKRGAVSPSSVRVIERRHFEVPVSGERMMAQLAAFETAETGSLEYYRSIAFKDASNSRREVMERTVLIRYDASNSYGTPLRHHGFCAFEDAWGNWRGFTASRVEYIGSEAGDPPTARELLDRMGDF
jgi:hypothetical protein